MHVIVFHYNAFASISNKVPAYVMQTYVAIDQRFTFDISILKDMYRYEYMSNQLQHASFRHLGSCLDKLQSRSFHVLIHVHA